MVYEYLTLSFSFAQSVEPPENASVKLWFSHGVDPSGLRELEMVKQLTDNFWTGAVAISSAVQLSKFCDCLLGDSFLQAFRGEAVVWLGNRSFVPFRRCLERR